MSATELCYTSATELAALLRAGGISAVELMRACLDRIENYDGVVNAIPTLRRREELLGEAEAADRARARGETLGLLHGLPIAIKDLTLTKGLRTTFGSRIYRDFVPTTDELYVARIKQAGAIVIGKTNTPEFGAGSQTYNAVFGPTRNPYDPERTCGGSSGGAAAALACGMIPIADGTDLGGSLRNPASFCNVVGFRPTPGRVPRSNGRADDTLGVYGPMGRCVADVRLLLAVMAGPDERDPLSLPEPGMALLEARPRDFTGVRVAWSDDLGRYPVERGVTAVLRQMRPVLRALGCVVENAEPDMAGVDEVFQTLRAAGYVQTLRKDYERHRELMKDTVVWNIERGLALEPSAVARAHEELRALRARVARFMETYEFLVLPVAQVLPFPVTTEWPRAIEGVAMQTYIDWMATCYAISCTGLPAASVPAGFTHDGLPVGLQVVGRAGRDADVLELARQIEAATGFGQRRPELGR